MAKEVNVREVDGNEFLTLTTLSTKNICYSSTNTTGVSESVVA